jgi:Met-zincin/Domain of unknown function (DUF5117)
MVKRILTAVFLIAESLLAQAPASQKSFAEITGSLAKLDGFVPLYWDEHAGKMWLEIDHLNQEMLYVTALSAGVGSNDLGLDRGKMNEPKVVAFERSGPRVLLVQANYAFRATRSNAAEQRAERDSFARSTLWGFQVAAEDGGRVLVDATAFLLRDAAGVAETLVQEKQGSYKVDETRSAFEMSLTKGFPRNTEIETTITVTGEPQGKFIRQVTPTPEAVTVREHQAFVALPEAGYRPRRQDPRAGFFSVDFMNFSAPLGAPVTERYIARHRLEKKMPDAAMSEAVQPIVYYVDAGAPEPIRSALIEGASWWNQAFEAAGFRDAFQVKVLPPEIDPMDARYNVIQWVHRSTRGWSYGNSLVDPRTGEIIKGIVTLGSLRARQDFLIFQGLMPPYAPGSDRTAELNAIVLARLRQLAAHEVGHTLGLEHNYIASTQGRASVMDYPAPQIKIRADNTFDLSQAYAKGIGEWDKVSIAWGYSQFKPDDDERATLDHLLERAAKRGLTFITDADSRPPGGAHPQAHLWDNGGSAVEELKHVLKVRELALGRFGENNIPHGTPTATLEEVLVPLYFMHRYQTEAAAKLVGGNAYTYALRGDGQKPTQIVPAAEQRAALEALLETIRLATLVLPERILALIPPRPPAFERTRETFPNRTGVTFDPLAGAEAAADLTISLLLNPQRAARLDEYHARNADNPAFPEVVAALYAATWKAKAPPGLAGQVAWATKFVLLKRLIQLATDTKATTETQTEARDGIGQIKNTGDRAALQLIELFERNPKQMELTQPSEAPPGQPIGEAELF